MEKTEIRAVIKFFHRKGLKAKEIKSELDSILGGSSPSHITKKCCVAKFKIGCTSTEGELHSQHLVEATTLEMIKKFIKLYWNIAESRVGDSRGRRHVIGTSTQNFTQTFGYEEAVYKMGAVFAHT